MGVAPRVRKRGTRVDEAVRRGEVRGGAVFGTGFVGTGFVGTGSAVAWIRRVQLGSDWLEMVYRDPFSLDRELRAGAEAWRRWRRALRRGAGESSPFGDSTRFGKTLYDAVRELPEEFPLRAGLLRWIYRLAEQRIDGPWLAREAALLRVERHPVREPEEGEFTLAEMTRAALRGRNAPEWHRARIRSLARLGAHRIELWQRRQEIAERMGVGAADEPKPVHPELVEEARTFLAETREVVEAWVERGPAAYVESALARPAGEGWPARLAPDTFVELLGTRDWFRGVALSPGPLPARLAPVSFLRALARLGAAWHLALTPPDRPFVLAQDPFGLRAWGEGALWALTGAEPVFLRRQLGLAAHRVIDHQRHLALALLQSVRLVAARCLLRAPALAGGATLRDASRELGVQLFREEMEAETLLGWTRLRLDDGERLAGAFLAARRITGLVEEHDEDWFRSPRAVEQLREEAKLSEPPHVAREELAEGRRLLGQRLVERLAR